MNLKSWFVWWTIILNRQFLERVSMRRDQSGRYVCLLKISGNCFLSSSLSSYLSSSPPPPTPSSPLSSSSPSQTLGENQLKLVKATKSVGRSSKSRYWKTNNQKNIVWDRKPAQQCNVWRRRGAQKKAEKCALWKRGASSAGSRLGPLHRGLDRPQTQPRGL